MDWGREWQGRDRETKVRGKGIINEVKGKR